MPLCTEIQRDGETLSIEGGWDYNVLSIMYSVATAEATPQRKINQDYTFGKAVKEGRFMDFSLMPIYYLDWKVPLVERGEQVLKADHTFLLHDDEGNIKRTVQLKKGDVLCAHREHKGV